MRGAAVGIARALAPWYGAVDGWVSSWIGGRNLVLFVAHFDQPEATPETARAIAERLAWTREKCHLLPLSEAMERMASGRLPPRPAVLFVDDATSAFRLTGYPILRELEIPFALAILPGLVPDDDRVHTLARLMRVAKRGAETPLREVAAAVRKVTGVAVDLPSYTAFFRVARGLDAPRLGDLRDELRLPVDPLMTWAELAAAQQGGVEVVNHSMSHPPMQLVADEWLDFEVRESRSRIAERLGVSTRDFVFPYGTRENVTAPVVAALAAAGYRAGYVVRMGVARPGAFLQPRAPLEARAPLHHLAASHALNTVAGLGRH